MAKVTKNLLLESEAVRRAERYSQLHGTSMSALVSDFFNRLPLEDDPPAISSGDLSPTVRRLFGVAAAERDVADYQDYLAEKYG